MAEKTVAALNSKDIAKAITDGRIFYATVTRVVPASKGNPLSVPLQVPIASNGHKSVPGVIFGEELDAYMSTPNAAVLVGMRIPFVIKSVDEENGRLICSRKIAQEKMKGLMMESLKSGEAFEGTITGFTNFGAFVDVNGVSGILRNADYSTDNSRINERYTIGDRISVKCKSISSDDNKYIYWDAVTKYHRTEPFVCDLERGAIVLGRIIDIKNFPQSQAVFVRLKDDSGLDVMCSMPDELEIEKGVSVVVHITNVQPGETEFARPRLRGRIMRLAS